MRPIRSAEEFLNHYGSDYLSLIGQIREACEQLKKTTGSGIIDTIYSREDATGGISPFKEPAKIANKVRQKGKDPGTKSYLELNDVVGLTIVLRYPDGIHFVLREIKKRLKPKRIKIGPPERHENRGGYYATHVVCSGKYGAQDLKCEVQLKSILHDAWSAKMHDLTYKPIGALDPKLNALMASIATTIQSLEQQSQLIRDMIQSGWNVEEKTRRAARQEMFDNLPIYKKSLWEKFASKDLIDLRQQIEEARDRIAAEPTDGKTIMKLTQKIDKCCSSFEELRFAWIVAGRMASLRPGPDLVRFFIKHADHWLEVASKMLVEGKIADREVSFVPLMFYVIGDLDRSIEYCELLTADTRFSRIKKDTKTILKFNRVAFLVEREYHLPTSHAASRNRIKADIEQTLRSADVRGMAEIGPAVLDTVGLKEITFAEIQEQVLAGIEKCLLARSKADTREKRVSDAYADLNLRLGWRRYFELEGRTIASST